MVPELRLRFEYINSATKLAQHGLDHPKNDKWRHYPGEPTENAHALLHHESLDKEADELITPAHRGQPALAQPFPVQRPRSTCWVIWGGKWKGNYAA